MKTSAILGVIVPLIFVDETRADGQIIFNTYASGSAYVRYSVDGLHFQQVPNSWHCRLFFSLGDITDAINFDFFDVPSGIGLQLYTGINNTAPMTAGYINGEDITIPGYTSGLVTFVAMVFDGPGIDSSIIRGHSLAFTETLTTAHDISPPKHDSHAGF